MKGRNKMRILTCEQVSDGHPDKLCDQIADAIVTDCLQNDPASRVAIECLMKDDQLVIAGELTSSHAPDYRKLVKEVFDRIGRECLGYPELPNLIIMVQSSRRTSRFAGVKAGPVIRASCTAMPPMKRRNFCPFPLWWRRDFCKS
jgi:hypothetical protein